jgi:hypothetical protein
MRPWSRAVGPTALILALLLAVVTTAASGGAVAQSTERELRMTVSLQADGNATVNVTTTVPIENESDHRAFEELATSFERGEGGVGFSADTFRQAAAAASDDTGRTMQIRDPTYQAIPLNDTGRLTLRFTWTNFAVVEGDRMLVGDAFNTTQGTWLPELTAGQSLVIEPPRGYFVDSAPLGASVEEGALRWRGPTTFEPGYLTIVYQQSGASPTETPPGGTFGVTPLVGAGLVGLLVVLLAAYVLVRRRDTLGGGEPVAAETNGGEETVVEARPDDPGDAGPVDDEPEELLSDEERVERLLVRNGGRMKQADIVSETGWSNAKVSQLLSSMDEAGRVDKLRIGRENLISLPDEDVSDIE